MTLVRRLPISDAQRHYLTKDVFEGLPPYAAGRSSAPPRSAVSHRSGPSPLPAGLPAATVVPSSLSIVAQAARQRHARRLTGLLVAVALGLAATLVLVASFAHAQPRHHRRRAAPPPAPVATVTSPAGAPSQALPMCAYGPNECNGDAGGNEVPVSQCDAPKPTWADVIAALHTTWPPRLGRLTATDPGPDWIALLVASGVFLALLACLGLTLVRRPTRPSRAARPVAPRSAVESRIGGRPSLEDRSLALSFGNGIEILIVADGLGGHAGGARAASIAARTSRLRLLRLDVADQPSVEQVSEVVRSIFPRVEAALRGEDAELGLRKHRIDGLRTTLLVAVRVRRELVVGAIGDGGVAVVRENGDTTAVFEPQRGDADNVLAASLGPTMDGEPIVRVLQLRPEDTIVAGTDGLVDRVSLAFYRTVVELLDGREPLDAVRFVLDTLLTSDAAPTFTDNVTLGVIAPERQ